MKTFSKELKQHWVDVMQAHQDADRLIQGSWWSHQKGCFFGCAMQTDDEPLKKAIAEMQLPAWLVHLSEKIFEGLPKENALLFPVQLLKAIPTETDISEVEHIIAVKRLEPLVIESNGDEVNNAIQQVIDYHKNTRRTEEERKAAYSVVRKAADLSADSVARSAHSAADSARSATVAAARSAVRLADSAVWEQERDNLIQALKG
tara:strand:+ start:13699 stop:14310 length:612 start_codon:yes stop_codon:yes gene_type:complete